ncbi:hypothetical protein C2G38_2221844 [Gigaspora rosea]|uniref:Uncharacterized protein n=1 Tax=Gigaspora rosea TaxID=44941 RepID=A0A397U4S6_9GLOM|nr:hypothetical protein C2G38_2221844 [Gigaspora rosea]
MSATSTLQFHYTICDIKKTFKEEATDQLAEIFGDSQWAEKNYKNGQLSWINLYENEPDKIKETDQIISESRGLLIEWQMKGFSDKAKHRYESGEENEIKQCIDEIVAATTQSLPKKHTSMTTALTKRAFGTNITNKNTI